MSENHNFNGNKMIGCYIYIEHLIFIFNVLGLILGMLLIVLGNLLQMDTNDDSGFTQFQWIFQFILPIIIKLIGYIIFGISLLGCYAVIRQNVCCLVINSGIMLALILFQLALIIVIKAERASVLDSIDQDVIKLWKKPTANRYELEIAFSCCGKNSYTDYTEILNSVPLSCCGNNVSSCSIDEAKKKPGCSKTVAVFVDKLLYSICYALLVFAIVKAAVLSLTLKLSSEMYKIQRFKQRRVQS